MWLNNNWSSDNKKDLFMNVYGVCGMEKHSRSLSVPGKYVVRTLIAAEFEI